MQILIFAEKLLLPLFWILLSFSFDLPYVAVMTILSAAAHELGHATVIMQLHGASAMFKSRLSGPKISIRGLNYKEEMLIAAGGPIANLLFCLILLPLTMIREMQRYAFELIMINLLTAISNLLPIRDFDGYKILTCLAAESRRYALLESLLYWNSLIITAAFALLSLYFILRIGEGYWGYALFLSIIISEIKKREEYTI